MKAQFETGTLRPEELDAWYAFCGRIFQGTGAAYFRAHYENDPDARCEDIFVARNEKGEIAATVRLFTRSVFLQGRAVRVGGIGEVCTDPGARGNGLSTRLLTAAMEAMDARQWELGMLYGSLESHYGRQGFIKAPLCEKRVPARAFPAKRAEDEVRAFTKEDLNAVMGIYDLFSSGFDLNYRRVHSAYWEKWVMHEWKNPSVLTRGGKILAYADVQTREGCLRVREAGALPGEDEALSALIGELALQAQCGAVWMPGALFPALSGQTLPGSGLMLRMERPSCGFENVRELAAYASAHGLQWDTDDY